MPEVSILRFETEKESPVMRIQPTRAFSDKPFAVHSVDVVIRLESFHMSGGVVRGHGAKDRVIVGQQIAEAIAVDGSKDLFRGVARQRHIVLLMLLRCEVRLDPVEDQQIFIVYSFHVYISSQRR